MTKHINVGDPPASSLASCLRSFPGGFSLLTETARLRAFFVGDETPGSVAVVATSLMELSPPSLEGFFPLDRDIPVDHTWSQDGALLILLHRGGFAVHSRADGLSVGAVLEQSKGANKKATTDGKSTTPCTESTTTRISILELGVGLRYSGKNSFEGKVVSCISGATASRSALEHGSSTGNDHRRANGCHDKSYLIAVGGSFGIECHTLEIEFRRTDNSSGESLASARPDSQGDTKVEEEADQPSRCGTASTNLTSDVTEVTGMTIACRSFITLFCGYPVVAMGISPKSDLLAAVAMTGHVKVWDVSTIRDHVFSPVSVPSTTPPRESRRHSTGSVRGKRNGKGKGKDKDKGKGKDKDKGKGDDSRKERSQSGKKRPQGRRVSLEFMLADSTRPSQPRVHRGPEALWSATLDIARATSLSFCPDGSGKLALGCWDGQVVIFLPCALDATDGTTIDKPSVSKTMTPTNPADRRDKVQGEAHARTWRPVWREKAEERKVTGVLKGGEHFEDYGGTFVSWCGGQDRSPGSELVISSYSTAGYIQCSRPDDGNISSKSGLPQEVHDGPKPMHELSGPGFGIFAEGLGERIGGLLTRSGSRLTRRETAEKYSIHGMLASANFVALYDSDLCLHIVSLSEALKADILLAPLAHSAALQGNARNLSRVRSLQELQAISQGGQTARGDRGGATLVNNDHGLVIAESGHDELEEHDGNVHCKEACLRLTIIWRDAITGLESPDDGACTGGASNRGLLPFLPSHDRQDESISVDIRRGRVAIFTEYVVVVCECPAPTKGGTKSATQAKPEHADASGIWKAYPGGPNIHGLLIGGQSTATPLSPKLPKATSDLAQEYLLLVQESVEDEDERRIVTVRLLSDRDVSYRCSLPDSTIKRNLRKGMKAYVSPGYSGGTFVVALADDEDTRTCATIWRGSFDEGTPRVVLGSSKIVTTWPWPEPATLQLAGVAGPNCELILFKEKVEFASASGDFESYDRERVRWWFTWPELEIWRYVDAPRRLGGEDLSVADFVKIYQQLLESMLTAHDP